LQLWCEEELRKCISVDEVCSLLCQAHLLEAVQLQEACLAFIKDNLEPVVVTPKFGSLCAEWPEVALKVSLFTAGISQSNASAVIMAHQQARQRQKPQWCEQSQDMRQKWNPSVQDEFQECAPDPLPNPLASTKAAEQDSETERPAAPSHQGPSLATSSHKDGDLELTELSTALQQSDTEALQLEQQHLQLAVLKSKQDAFNEEYYELLRLTKVSQDVHKVLLSSDSLAPCCQQVVAAGCEVQPDWAGGAILLVPMTQDMYKELGWDMRSHHVFLQRKDRSLLEAALNDLPSRKRSQVRLDHRASWQHSDDGEGETEGPGVDVSAYEFVGREEEPKGTATVDKGQEEAGGCCGLEFCDIEVVATFVHFSDGHFELSEASSSRICCSAPAALELHDGSTKAEVKAIHSQNPRQWVCNVTRNDPAGLGSASAE